MAGMEGKRMFDAMSLAEFVQAAASDAPTPGGGGVAALAGSLGAAMASMAANFTVGRPKFASVDAEARAAVNALAPLVAGLLKGVDRDAEAFAAISAAFKLPRDGDSEAVARREAIRAALAGAMRAPLAVLEDCLKVAERLPGLAAIANPNLLSDVEVAAILIEAAGRAARVNVLVNAGQLGGHAEAEAEAARAVERLAELLRTTLGEVAKRRS